MEAQRSPEGHTLGVDLDAETFAELSRVAAEHGVLPHELVSRWVRERLAHERERALGRARDQRPRNAEERRE